MPTKQAPVTQTAPMTFSIVTIERSRTKVPPPDWALEAVQASFDNKIALGRVYEGATPELAAKAARSALHQIRRAAEELGYGLNVQELGAELRFQAKVKKKVVAPKPA